MRIKKNEELQQEIVDQCDDARYSAKIIEEICGLMEETKSDVEIILDRDDFDDMSFDFGFGWQDLTKRNKILALELINSFGEDNISVYPCFDEEDSIGKVIIKNDDKVKITTREKYLYNVLSLLKSNVKIEDYSMFAGPFSFEGLKINNKYKLTVEKNIKTDETDNSLLGKVFGKRTIRFNEYFIKNIEDDRTIQITETDFNVLCIELKNIDTDSVKYFLNRLNIK